MTPLAVVTGAASGIGRATALRLLREGVAVVAVDIDEPGLMTAAGAGARPLVADLGTEEGCAAVVEAGAGGDYLVNAAAIIRLQPLLEVTRQDWRDLFRINAESVFFLCQQLGPQLRPGGAIVNLSSVSAKLTSTPETAVYAATKTAILAVTRSFAYALAERNVRVNAICPASRTRRCRRRSCVISRACATRPTTSSSAPGPRACRCGAPAAPTTSPR